MDLLRTKDIREYIVNKFFASPLPEIKLIGAISNPYDLSIASARTCYSSKGIVTPEEVSKDEKSRKLRDEIAQSTLEAGHLTTRQHAHFVFALSGVSRSFIWSFLHSHPFYNSEQVSQRYVKVKDGTFTVPILEAHQKAKYEEILKLQMGAYHKLIELLLPSVAEEYYRIFPSRKKDDRWNKVIQKKAYEIARYVLPIATQAYMYHTVSALTLLRYYKMMNTGDTPTEQTYVVSRMVEKVLKLDPEFKKEFGKPFNLSGSAIEKKGHAHPEETVAKRVSKDVHGPLPNNFTQAKRFCQAFDLELSGKYSKLISSSENAEQILAHAVRNVLGVMSSEFSDEKAIDYVLDPKHNPLLGDTLNVTTLSKLTRALFHAHFTFQKKISHTADSQDQRHRMTPASRPILSEHYYGEPDIIYPKLMNEVPKAKVLYDEVTSRTVETMNALLKENVSFEKVHYLLPNGWAVRFDESGDLLNWHHKWKLRTCYNAQEEIFYASVQELLEVEKKFPLIAKHIKAPCYLRRQASVKPFCPEGDRYCGVPVWNQNLDQYDRLI